MKIEKLEIKGFGKLNNMNILFSKGLNIVFGKNESGKSSVQWFIKGMLFGLKGGKTSKDGIPPPVKKFKPWLGNEYSGFLEYKLENGEIYRISRNFSNNTIKIFDSLFNDITSSFEANKEKGVAFSEKHLGLNEACFDRTVFIRQMESIIDDDGSRELLNRLVNVSQTGFEDISFKKAQEALKEALKSYVGTDKTTTRPLDKIVNRLEELKTINNLLVTKRESMFSVEEELNKAISSKDSLENKKTVMASLKNYVILKINIRSIKKLKNDINEILENIIKDEEELKVILIRMAEFNKIKAEFGKFCIYDNEDIDKLERDYQKLLNLKEENDKLKIETFRKQENLAKLKILMGSIKTFNNLEEDIEINVQKLNSQCESLKIEYSKININTLNENIKNVQKKEKAYKIITVLASLLTILSVGLSIIIPIIGIPVAIIVALITAAIFKLKINEAKKTSGLMADKNLIVVNANSLNEEIRKKEKELRDIFSVVDADNLQVFLMKKVDYKNKFQQVSELTKDISRMENVIELNFQRIAEFKKLINDKLLEVGLRLGDSFEIIDKGISEFKYGIRRFKGNQPSIAYTEQRIEDLTKGLQKNLKNVTLISSNDCNSKEDLLEIVDSLDNEYNALITELNICNNGITELIKKEEFLKLYFSNLSEKYIEENLDEISTILDNEDKELEEELKKAILDIKEYVTELKHQPDNEDEIHKIDEEIESLCLRKNYLEDTNISLKTALDVLTEASMEIQRDFVPALNNKMSDIINRISGGRYMDLRADDKLTLKTISPETGEVVNASLLSGGTTDQMYLALRVAMSEIFTSEKEALPLIMDEVFSQYDDERTRETFRFLNSIVKDKQVIFFTCKGREVEIAREIFGGELNVIGI